MVVAETVTAPLVGRIAGEPLVTAGPGIVFVRNVVAAVHHPSPAHA